jgi:O-antigen ligase
MVRRGQTEKVVGAFILSGLFAASVAVFDNAFETQVGHSLSGTLGRSFWGRYAGPLGHPNKLGYYLVLTSTLSLFKWLGVKRVRHSFLHLASFVIQIGGIYLSGSVTAFLGLILSLIVTFLMIKQSRNKLLILSSPILFLLALVTFASAKTINVSASAIIDGILRNTDRVQNITASSRIIIYKLTLKEIADNPFIGVGYDQFSTSGLGADARLIPGTIHNVFLQTLYVGGILSFLGLTVIYLYLAIQAIIKLRKSRSKFGLSNGLAICGLAVILMDQFQDAIYQREKWLIVGLFLGLACSSGFWAASSHELNHQSQGMCAVDP